jgi:assimilatory nitrate reductase catalytic subunit
MTVRTICPYCGVGCGLLVTSDGTVSGDPNHPANFGRPSWDEALDLVAARFTQAVARDGPDAVAFYVSGQLLTED